MPQSSSVHTPTSGGYPSPVMATYECPRIERTRLDCAVFFALLGLSIVPSAALDAQNDASVRGLPGMAVRIDLSRSLVARPGPARNQLQTDVELRLRQYGIRVLTHEEVRTVVGQP